MAVGDWSATDLCLDRDLKTLEGEVLEWAKPEGDCSKWRAKAKKQIGDKLRFALKSVELATEEAEVLDLIENPEELLDVACYKTLQLLCNDRMTSPNDKYAAKTMYYKKLFDEEWGQAVSMLNVDTDESGDITDSEKYNMSTGVKLGRGL